MSKPSRNPSLTQRLRLWDAFRDVEKLALHREAKKALKALASALGLQPGEFEIRSNLAGPAVSGEVTLHTNHWYVQLSAGWKGQEVLFRLCNGRKDYTGFQNRFAGVEALESPEAFATRLAELLGSVQAHQGPMSDRRFEISEAALARFSPLARRVA